MTNNIFHQGKTLTIRRDGSWKHIDGRFIAFGDEYSDSTIVAISRIAPLNSDLADDLLSVIFAHEHKAMNQHKYA